MDQEEIRNFVKDTTNIIPAKYGFKWLSGLRREDQNVKSL